ncbi:TPA: dTMP kinase [bacterium]|nr:dTMP kinase [bacterium]
MFIAFEGGEGTGKSSQVTLLAKEFKKRGISYITTKEPKTPGIRKLLFGKSHIPSLTELLLFIADRKIHVEDVIKPALTEGKNVITDRFFLSTIAYQGYGRGINIDLIERLNCEACTGTFPDVNILLDIDEEEGLKRKARSDRLEREDISFHKKIREGYLELAKKMPDKIRVVDGRRKKKEIHNEIMSILKQWLH